MSYAKVMLHYIWATKGRTPIITPELKVQLLPHIAENCKQKSIYLDSINCVSDHIHLLISLATDQTIAQVAQLIKGESSYWVNNKKLIESKFAWQNDYLALSVSQSAIEKLRQYIANQEEHHRHKTFTDEYDSFIKIHGLEK